MRIGFGTGDVVSGLRNAPKPRLQLRLVMKMLYLDCLIVSHS